MKNYKRIIAAAAVLALSISVLTCTAFAIDESEVQNAVSSSSREEVAGNILIWFLCAIGFLKVSQKIDSFMLSLGINVGQTGGSMLGELMIAGKAIAGAAGAAGHTVSNLFAHSHTSSNAAAGQAYVSNQMGHGVIGMTQQAAANAGAAAVTGQGKGISAAAGGKMFESSLEKNSQFSTDIIRSVATGSISHMGLMSGPQAAEALSSYMGYGISSESVSNQNTGVMHSTNEVTGGNTNVEDTVIIAGGSAGGAQIPQPEAGTEAAPSGPSGGDVITLNGGTAGVPISPTEDAETISEAHEGHEHTEQRGSVPAGPVFSKVEIGGGRITGWESPAGGGEQRQFAMYNAKQYTQPTGAYETVATVDGESWYKQYAQPTLEKTPRSVSGNNVKYENKIVMQMPPVPKRKDRI